MAWLFTQGVYITTDIISASFLLMQVFDLDSGNRLATHCGTNTLFIEGESHAVRVVFRTDESVTHKGWVLEWAGKYLYIRESSCLD